MPPNQRRSELLLYGIIVLLPTYLLRWQIGGVPINCLDVIVFGSALWFIIEQRRQLWVGLWSYAMVGFAIIGAIATVHSPEPLAALGLYKSYVIAPLLVGWMVLVLKPRLSAILYCLVGSMSFVLLIGFIQYLTGYGIPAPWNNPTGDFRLTSVYDYPNAVGLFLAPILAMCIAWVMHERSHRKLFIQLTLLGCGMLLLSHTQGAVIAVIVAGVFTLLYTRWRLVTLAIAGAALVLALLWQPTRDVLLFQDTSGQVRLALWQGTANVLEHEPWLGAGLAGFPSWYAQYKLDQHTELLLYPHNLFLDFWVEFGLLGLLWLVMMLGSFFVRLARNHQPHSIVLLAGMVAILVYGLVDVPYFKNDLAIVFWLVLTLSSTIKQLNK